MLTLKNIFPLIDKAKKQQQLQEQNQTVYDRSFPAPQISAPVAVTQQPSDVSAYAQAAPLPAPQISVPVSPTFPVNQPMQSPAPLPAPMSVNEVMDSETPSFQQPAQTAILPAPSLTLETSSSVPLSQQTTAQMHALDKKDYSKAVYRRPDGSETSHPTTDGTPNELVKAAGADRNKKWSTGDKIRNALLGGLIGFAQNGIGGAIVGSAAAGTNRNYRQEMSDKKMLAGLRPQLAEQQKNESFNLSQDVKKTGIINTLQDNEQRTNEFKQKTADAKAKLEQTTRDKARDGFYKRYKFFDPAKATPAQIDELKQFGQTPETVGKFDFTKPEFKEMGGVTSKWNPSTAQFEDTNLATNPEKAFVDYDVTDTDGVVHKFRISAGKAAQFITSTKNAGMQIQAADRRQANQQKFTAGENEANRALRRELQKNAQAFGREQTVQKAVDAYKRLYQSQNGNPPTAKQIEDYQNAVNSNLDSTDEQ